MRGLCLALCLFCLVAAAARSAEPPTEPPVTADAPAPPRFVETPASPAAVAPPAESTLPVAPGTLLALPAMTPLRLRLLDQVSSQVNHSGDRFRLDVLEDVRVNDATVIPAGTVGEGEVIHAAASGGGGKGGELLLAGRFLRVGDQNVRIRSLVLGAAGRDRSEQALATSFVAGPFAMFVHGGVIVIPPGTEANAKTLETVQLPATQPGPQEPPSMAPEAAPAEPAPQPQEPPGTGRGD